MKLFLILFLILSLTVLTSCSNNDKSYVFKSLNSSSQNDLECYKLCLNREKVDFNYTCHTVPVKCNNYNCTCITD